ncbi:MAG: hypothetical protein AAGK02_00780 [Pseudomonadota bacterium]
MSTEKTKDGWNALVAFNLNCLRATAGFGLAWVFWRVSQQPGLELLLYLAGVFALAGAKRAIQALIGLVRLILRARRWARYRRKGVAPKADRMASNDDLKRRGLIR